jgi:uridylate kinase
MRTVIKIGGSLLYDEKGNILTDRIRKYALAVKNLVEEGHQLVVIVGGGKPARSFITAARELGASEVQCDWFGIKLARHNAELLIAALGDLAYPKVVESLDELETASCIDRVVLMGGLLPGQSTNAAAALAAEAVHADRLLNATNVGGIYDHDPRQPGAKKMETVSIAQLRAILAGSGTKAGEYELFDPVAIGVVERSRIETVVFDGTDPDNLLRLFKGKKVGSTIVPQQR